MRVRLLIFSFTAKFFLVSYSQQIIRHPYYSDDHKKNDIALIRLQQTIFFTKYVRPACLHTDVNDVEPTVNLTATGWGIEKKHSIQNKQT